MNNFAIGHALSEVATVPFEECASRGYNQQKAELVLTARTVSNVLVTFECSIRIVYVNFIDIW